MPSSITQSQLLPILGAVVAFLFAALLLLYIFRLLFGRRIKAPGPRNRPRRLDIVDTFDLDRERQLVIVRRDNTEHLVLIGGPNDVLIEASINRNEGRDARPVAAREKEPAAGPAWPGAPLQTPPAPPPIEPTAQPIFAEPPKRKAIEGAAPPPAGGPPLHPLPPDLFAPPTKPAPHVPEPPPVRTAAPPRFTPPPPPPSRTGGTGFTPTPRPPRPAPPPFLSRAPRPAGQPPAAESAPPPESPPSAEAAPSSPPPHEPLAPPPAEQAPPPAPAEATPPAPAGSTDPLESLEAEMARLLGRPESKP